MRSSVADLTRRKSHATLVALLKIFGKFRQEDQNIPIESDREPHTCLGIDRISLRRLDRRLTCSTGPSLRPGPSGSSSNSSLSCNRPLWLMEPSRRMRLTSDEAGVSVQSYFMFPIVWHVSTRWLVPLISKCFLALVGFFRGSRDVSFFPLLYLECNQSVNRMGSHLFEITLLLV